MPFFAASKIRRSVTAASALSALVLGAQTVHGATPTVAALPGYAASVFARGGSAYSHPDSIIEDSSSGRIYVAYANLAAKDGSGDGATTIVQYDRAGKVLRTFSTPGHGDGLRMNSRTHDLWALSNEDANPLLYVINTASGTSRRYTFPKTPHGGGYDDIAFTNGMIFMDASNPNVNGAGVNVFPALYKVALSGSHVKTTPVLMGNASAVDLASHAKTQLNLVDPDSMIVNPGGVLVLDNQAGAQQVFISRPGTVQQYVTASPVGTQVDDTAYVTAASGRLLMSDTNANTVYAITGAFAPGTAYATTQSDSGVTGMVGLLAPLTGYVTPVAIGFDSPHGMIFVPAK